jgi:hypothetical protein
MNNIANAQNNMSVEQIVLLITSQNSKVSWPHIIISKLGDLNQSNKQTNKQKICSIKDLMKQKNIVIIPCFLNKSEFFSFQTWMYQF